MKQFFSMLVILAFLMSPLIGDNQPRNNFKEVSLDITAMEKTIDLPADSMAVIKLKCYPSTGQQWMVINHSGLKGTVREVHGSPYGEMHAEFEAPAKGEKFAPGSALTQIIRLVGEKPGLANVTLVLGRPWEAGHVKMHKLNINSHGKFTGKFSPRKAEDNRTSRASADVVYAPGLPAHWDWREQNGVTPVRDQMNCNSCWAFGTVAAMEAKLLIKDGASLDLSEQYIVDCNDDGFSCGGGGWWGHDYHWFKVIPGVAGAGCRYESDYPYANADTTCVDKTPHEQLEGWAYTDDVADSAWPMIEHTVTTAQLKQKIYDYGPVATDICSSTWNTYTGGVFTTHCSPGTHIVLITGWDDYDGAFYIKNSWGASWGESGYIRLAYDTCLVGHNSTYLLYEKTNPRIIYRAGVFHEHKNNNGSINNSLELRIEDSTSSTRFSRSSGYFSQGSEFTVSNLPNNLSMSIQATSNTTAVVSLSGSANSHADANDISNLTISFQNAAFTGNNAAAVESSTYSSLQINFFDPYQLIHYVEPTVTYINAANPWIFYYLDGSNYKYSFGLWWYDSVNEPDPNNNQCLKFESYTKPCLSKNNTVPADLRALSYGEEIGPNQYYWAPGGSYGGQHTIAGPAHHDFKGGERYMGFTFNYNGYPVYGWMKFNVSSDGSYCYLMEYAWQQDPNKSITAGQTTDGGGGTAPVASFYGNPTTVDAGGTVSFTDQSTGSPTSWSWSFPGGSPSSSTSPNPTVVYNNTGTYNVSLTVSNSYGSDSMTQSGYITVNSTGNAPVADFAGTPTTLTDSGTVQFTCYSSNNPTSWSWSFPGGSPSSSTSQNPTVSYSTVGSYSVTLTVSNAYGSDTITKSSYITVNSSGGATYCSSNGNNLTYEWIASVQVGSLNNSTSASSGGYGDYTSQSVSLSPGSSVSVSLTPGFASSSYTEYWRIWIDFNGNGSFDDSGDQVFSGSGSSTVSGSLSVPSNASGTTRMRVSMKYSSAPTSCGSFTYGEVEDYTASFGGSPNPPPTANFTASPTSLTEGGTVYFTDLSTDNPTSFSWSFPGGSPSSSSSQNPAVTYNNPGTYSVTLNVSNSYGSDSMTKSGYISVSQAGSPPVADFSGSPTSVNEGNYVQFSDNSSGSPTSWSWSFPGGSPSSSSSQNPNVYYSSAGTYNVSLSVSNNYGSDSTTKYGYITVSQVGTAPTASFSGSPTTVTEGGSVSFSDQSSGNPTSWSWSFPGGSPSSSSSQNPNVTYNNAGTYNVSLTVSNNYGSDSITQNGYITVEGGTTSYCSSSGNSTTYEWIAGVQINSFYNTSGANGYTDFTSQTVTLSPGSSPYLYLTPGFSSSSYTENWMIWIDFNKNGSFDDSGENVFSGSGSSTVSGSFNVPSSASGSTRMRVSMRYYNNPSSCGSFDYGEVEDYTVNF